MTTQTTTIGKLAVGTIVNYYNCVNATDVNYLVVDHYSSKWGNFTKVIDIETREEDSFTQHTEITNFWSVVSQEQLN